MRELNIGSKRFTRVVVVDDRGQGGANHEYTIESVPSVENYPVAVFGRVSFQNGPVKEFGINGCHQEDLLAIVIDRLEGFQAGPYACRENALALTKIQEALHWLNHRTEDRKRRGVEGTNEL